MVAQATRIVGKFDGAKVPVSAGIAHYAFILEGDQQLITKVYGQQMGKGAFTRQ